MATSGHELEPFPTITDSNNTNTNSGKVKSSQNPAASRAHHGGATGDVTRTRAISKPSSVAGIVRTLSQEFEESRPHEGLMAATGDIVSSVVADQERHRRATAASSEDTTLATPTEQENGASVREHTEPFANGYHFPPKYPWKESTRHGLASFWKFFITPMGAFWTIYGLNVVAWGGMLFLLLCNAAPAMCTPDCNDIDSPRRRWVEYDSQVLTALFCVTAFGLAPWRFRDLWYLLKYRVNGDYTGLRRLAGIHRSWFRLEGSQGLPNDIGPPDNIPETLPEAVVPIPAKHMPNAPLTGSRAPATSVWKLDFVIWSMVLNTFAQCGLCGIMWGINRYDRPSWTTGFLVAVGCIIAIVGGLAMFYEGKHVKSIEGVPCSDRDLKKLAADEEKGLPHYNNIKDKKPKIKVKDLEANPEKNSEKNPVKK